jgi:hypothetical protein
MKLPLAMRVRLRRFFRRMFKWLRPNKLEAWAARDQMLMDQWWASFENKNHKECKRLRVMMRHHWTQYRKNS